MKKIVLLALSLLLTIGVKAQHEEETFTVQPRVGMNISTMNDYNKAKFGYSFGMEIEYQIDDMWSLAGALMYSDQGGIDKSNGVKEVLDIDYVNVPITFNCYLLPGLAVKAGMQPAFRTKTSVTIDGSKTDVDWLLKQYGEDTKMSKFMLSVPVGISYEYKNVVLDARYNIGLTDIFKEEGVMRNHVFQLTLGYKFEKDFF